MPVEFKHATLDNGLTVIAEVDPSSHSAAMGFFVKTGARDEDPSLMGVSHYLEHMMFKGTSSRRAEDVDRGFDELGVEHNAFTTNEMTAFWVHALPESLPEAEAILSDILRPALRVEDFEDEKSVILEEIAMYDDQPFWQLYERAMEVYYGTHPLSHRVLGTRETIAALERDQMARYFENRYSADNTVVALAGRLDFDAMVERVATHCGHWTRTDAARPLAPVAYPDETVTIESDAVHRHYSLMLAPGPAVQDDRRFAAGVLVDILGDFDGSRLYWSLVEPGIAEEAAAEYVARDGVGDYMFYLCCPPESADQAEALVMEELGKLIGSLAGDDLVRARSKIATAETLRGELPAGRMRRLGRMWTYSREYRPLEDDLARIDSVTLDDLGEVAETFPLVPRVTGRLRPAG